MNISLSWADFKVQATIKPNVLWIERDEFYNIYYGTFETSVLKDSGSDQTDFETNYKSQGNKYSTQAVEVKSQPDPMPFAQPTYRTKMNATSGIITIAPGANSDVQFQLTSERYVTGGSLVVHNAQIGDYIVAEVEDIDGLIPSPYRAALCEAWPVISTYIEKRWVEVQGEHTVMKINTYPLNAKISAGLYLCIHYYAVNTGSDRTLGINYDLTKKL